MTSKVNEPEKQQIQNKNDIIQEIKNTINFVEPNYNCGSSDDSDCFSSECSESSCESEDECTQSTELDPKLNIKKLMGAKIKKTYEKSKIQYQLNKEISKLMSLSNEKQVNFSKIDDEKERE